MVPYADFIHSFLATLALIVLVSASLQALLLAGQEWILKQHKQAFGFIQYFPPLEVMEIQLFKLIALAIILLSVILTTSFILFHPVFFKQCVYQKLLISLLAWGILLMLLIGRSYFGWRGKIAISWTLMGASLMGIVYLMAYFYA
ncbi:cytochrome c biogenesis protein [Rickettsiella grylli]|uniref:Cytochrome C assembly family protein n=1 Tax=Rickettsiella grylli TaxID=59196 RepID=A8PP07_9COXI|nr:cytochrome c biogenesis protein [Rickettsiella grylli]EDP46728.1 cytochrome C assembly family protein [Rickettsiella grylli]